MNRKEHLADLEGQNHMYAVACADPDLDDAPVVLSIVIQKLETLQKYPLMVNGFPSSSHWLLDYDDVKKFIKENI